MSNAQFADRAPAESHLTPYDERCLIAYLQLLDAADKGADWREVAANILGVDPRADPLRARSMHDSHLARARWMTEVGYAHLLGCDRTVND